MKSISIIIDGERFDSVETKPLKPNICDDCELEGHQCALFRECPLPTRFVFKKSTKSFER